MAGTALSLPEEERLSSQLGFGRLLGIELPVDLELRCRRKIEQLLQLGHEMDLASALEDVHALLRGNDWIAVEVSRALFELGEILDGPQGALGPEEALNVDPAKGRRLD